MQLSPNFSLEEFSIDGEMPTQCVPLYQNQCQLQLETIRAQFNAEVIITSGYRTPSSNEAAGGVVHSQHVATNVYSACDFRIVGMKDMRPAFDWIRGNAELPFDQLILEHDPANSQDIIHISYSRAFQRREALEGDTANLTGYTHWPSAMPA